VNDTCIGNPVGAGCAIEFGHVSVSVGGGGGGGLGDVELSLHAAAIVAHATTTALRSDERNVGRFKS
jgi:hypothetical protein